MLIRAILPDWAYKPGARKVCEGDYSPSQIEELNSSFYNIYYLPNHPANYEPGKTVDGTMIDTFNYVYVDMDLKDGHYKSKDEFLSAVAFKDLRPTKVVDSGNGIHVYWRVSDLDAMSFLRLQRRLCWYYTTDEAVSKIYQLMRLPGTVNTKHEDGFVLCQELESNDNIYTCEELDRFLPAVTQEDEKYCQEHYAKTYNRVDLTYKVTDKLPVKFGKLLNDSKEVKEIWAGEVTDRSISDCRLGHIMFAHGFTKDEAMSVLVNAAKALQRSPHHRIGYAEGIVSKIWTFEEPQQDEGLSLSSSVKDILQRSGDTLKGTRFPCWSYIDDTAHGFRLGQVMGLVAGSGVGKTTKALNMFEGFVQNNPDYEHFFVPLEQPANEIADHWKTMCGENTRLHDKVHIISNYADDGAFRHLSLADIQEYILKFQIVTGKKVGCVVIDHVGALKKEGKNGENQDLMDICHAMKAFAVQTNTFLVMQSQAPREKAGIGDLELNKDAAYGTVYFESYCDYLVTVWQPLKRCYSDKKCPTVTAFKFCKIRHKKQGIDRVQEDICYRLVFDPATEHLRVMTQSEETSFNHFNNMATNKRKADRKTDIVSYVSAKWE